MKIMTIANPKLLKSVKKGWASIGLMLAPSDLSGNNVCSKATDICKRKCLFFTGRGRWGRTQDARIRRTNLLFEDPKTFWSHVRSDIEVEHDKNKHLCVRMNVLSDMPWERMKVSGTSKSIFELYPDIQFYDYTKVPKREIPDNYHLTFSLAEDNDRSAMEEVWERKRNLSVVMLRNRRKFYGLSCIDGDKNDLRFLDPWPRIVRLTAKGDMKNDTGGFVR